MKEFLAHADEILCYHTPDMERARLQILFPAVLAFAMTWFLWLPGNPLLGHGCTQVLTGTKIFSGPAWVVVQPGILAFLGQKVFSAFMPVMAAVRLLWVLYVFAFLYGYWLLVRELQRPEFTWLFAVPLVFNAAVCSGDFNLAWAMAVFPWSIWGALRFGKRPVRLWMAVLLILDGFLYYADLAVFLAGLGVQFFFVLRAGNRRSVNLWFSVTVFASLPFLIWSLGHHWSLGALFAGRRDVLARWYVMSGNCFRWYFDEWAFVLAAFAVLIGLLGRGRSDRVTDWSVLALLSVVLIVSSPVRPRVGYAARLVVPLLLLLPLTVTPFEDLKWHRGFVVLVGLAAFLSLVSVNLGMVRWMRETRPYVEIQNLVHSGDEVRETCSKKKRSRAVFKPGWFDWDHCVMASRGALGPKDKVSRKVTISCGKQAVVETTKPGKVVKIDGWVVRVVRVVQKMDKVGIPRRSLKRVNKNKSILLKMRPKLMKGMLDLGKIRKDKLLRP